MEGCNTSEQISFFSTLFRDNLPSQIAQVVANFSVLNSQLLIKDLFLPQTPLEHVNVLSKLIIFKLILVSFSSDVFITFFSELFKLSMLGLL